MTQGIPHSTRSYEFSPAYLAKITPKVRPRARKDSEGWFVAALSSLRRAIVRRRAEEVPGSLVEDVGLSGHTSAHKLRSAFNRLDAPLHARFY